MVGCPTALSMQASLVIVPHIHNSVGLYYKCFMPHNHTIFVKGLNLRVLNVYDETLR